MTLTGGIEHTIPIQYTGCLNDMVSNKYYTEKNGAKEMKIKSHNIEIKMKF